MANLSNKNFSHAYGAGRVIASFSLSHPGGPPGDIDPEAPPQGAADMLLPPPAQVETDLPTDNPYPGPTTVGTTTTWGPDRQPYNATSIGVFVTGSGTRRLPYRTALGLEVPSSLSDSLNQVFPDNGVYPFEAFDAARIGSTHGQVVCGIFGESFELGGLAYYEVGLDWDLPPFKWKRQVGIADPVTLASTWENKAIASFERALMRTFWVTASLNCDAFAEAHPDANYTPPAPAVGPTSPLTVNQTYGAVDGTIADIRIAGGVNAYAEPYGGSQTSNLLGPAFPSSGEDSLRFSPVTVQTQISTIITKRQIDLQPDGTLTGLITAVPIVRVWVMMPIEAAPGELTPKVAPRPLPRRGVNPYTSGSVGPGTIIPAVNVQVTQKNSSAVDGSDNGVYDLWTGYAEMGGAS